MILLCFSPSVTFAFFVKGPKASILEEAKFGSSEVASLSQGDEVEKLEQDKTWYRVQFGDVTGWIPRMALSEQAPLGTSGSLLDNADDLSSKARKRASATATAGAGRGLLEGSEEQLTELKNADFRSLKRLESHWIDPVIGQKFLEARF